MRHTSEELFKTAQAAVPAIGLEGETTPKEISPYVLARCQELEKWPPVWVAVESSADGLYGFCHPALNRHVRRFGGEKVPGWCVWEWPGLGRSLECHPCWKEPSGRLVDIIRKPQNEKTILFLPASPGRAETNWLWPGVPA